MLYSGKWLEYWKNDSGGYEVGREETDRRAWTERGWWLGEGIAVPAWFFPACTILLTGKWCMRLARRNAAVSQQAAIQSPSHALIRNLQGLNYGRRCHCSRVSRLLSGSPRAPTTLLCSHYVGNVRASPLVQLWLLKNGVHSTKELLLRNVLGLNFLVAFSDWGEARQASFQTHAHTLIRESVSIITAYTEQLMS